jgi:hypothetical protein
MPLISIVSPSVVFSDIGCCRAYSNQRDRKVMTGMALRCLVSFLASVAACLALPDRAHAAGCAFEAQGEGHVAAVIDARSFRLDDGREIRLAGIEPADADRVKGAAALAAVISGRDVTLHGADDTPDR